MIKNEIGRRLASGILLSALLMAVLLLPDVSLACDYYASPDGTGSERCSGDHE